MGERVVHDLQRPDIGVETGFAVQAGVDIRFRDRIGAGDAAPARRAVRIDGLAEQHRHAGAGQNLDENHAGVGVAAAQGDGRQRLEGRGAQAGVDGEARCQAVRN